MKLTSTSACTAVVLLLGALPVSAQQMDMAVYNTWSTVTVVHYVVVGEFSAVASVASSLDRSTASAKARVKDRVEVTFDWDGSEMKATSTPVIKNFPTTIDSVTP